ncbi:MAG: preprotein translocase subunit YajC [Clostridiales bacterium]|nr:preprotein translocase subunit YajC [Clostridiales bacterium]
MPAYASQIIMIVALFAIMYFMMIRPQRKKDKEIKEMRDSLAVGDEILTIGGIYGKVVKIKDDKLTIQVGSDRTRIDITKWAVNNIEEESDSKPKETKDDQEETKVSPKSIRRLGAASEQTEAEAEQDVVDLADAED